MIGLEGRKDVKQRQNLHFEKLPYYITSSSSFKFLVIKSEEQYERANSDAISTSQVSLISAG